jgi:hypothetical protein
MSTSRTDQPPTQTSSTGGAAREPTHPDNDGGTSRERQPGASRQAEAGRADGSTGGVTPAVAGIRRYNRVDVEVEVILQDQDGWEYPTEAVDLSPSGIFVASEFLFDEGTEHDIIFRDPSGDTLFRLAGRVVRVADGDSSGAGPDGADSSPPGMAYEFHRASAETRRRLEAVFGDETPGRAAR